MKYIYDLNKMKRLIEQKVLDKFLNGKAFGLTLEDIFIKWPNVSEDKLKREYELGLEIEEEEHSDDKEVARRITLDHMMESPTYYRDLLKHVEKTTAEKILKEFNWDNDEEESEDDLDLTLERQYENSDNIQDILTAEDCEYLMQFIQLHEKKKLREPFIRRLDSNSDGTSTERLYYLAKLDTDVKVRKRRLVLKAGYYTVEKFINSMPKINSRIYTGGYDDHETALERTIGKLLDLENTNAGTEITIMNYGMDYDTWS